MPLYYYREVFLVAVNCTAIMGATLSSHTESANEKGGKLDLSEGDGELMLEISRYVDTLCNDHPNEALVPFKRPFVWKSSLFFSNFNSLSENENENYVVR